MDYLKINIFTIINILKVFYPYKPFRIFVSDFCNNIFDRRFHDKFFQIFFQYLFHKLIFIWFLSFLYSNRVQFLTNFETGFWEILYLFYVEKSIFLTKNKHIHNLFSKWSESNINLNQNFIIIRIKSFRLKITEPFRTG